MKIKKIIMIVSIIVIYFLIYKYIFLIKYTQNTDVIEYANEIINKYKEKETITIEKKSVKNYIKFENLKLENIFNNYEKIESETNQFQYAIYNESGIDKYVSIIESISFVDKYINGFQVYKENIETITLYDKEKTKNYLKENNITNDIELFDFIIKNINNKNNALTNRSKMKENHYIKEYTVNVIPKINKLYILSGEFQGYILELSNSTFEVFIDQYMITVRGFEKEEIMELVRTIIINEEK